MSRAIPSQVLRWEKLLKNPTCRTCKTTKTPADFPRIAVDYQCRNCRAKWAIANYHIQRSALPPDELRSLRDKVNKRQNERRKNLLESLSPEELVKWRAASNAQGKASRDRVRDEVYQAYGGYRCNCCGVDERAFLSIDHVNNDGAHHRRLHGHVTGEQMHRWLLRNGFPPGFQVLCMNCQWGKRNNNGVCPHQERCRDHPERE